MAKIPKQQTQRALEPNAPASPEDASQRVEEIRGTEETMEGTPGPAEVIGEPPVPAPDAVELPPTPGLEAAPSDVVVANVEDTVYVAPEAPAVAAPPVVELGPSAEMPPGVAAPTSVDGQRVLSTRQVWPPDADNRVEAHFVVEGGKDLLAWTSNDGATWSLF